MDTQDIKNIEKMTTIKISVSTRDRLKKYGKFSDTYNTLLIHLMDIIDRANKPRI